MIDKLHKPDASKKNERLVKRLIWLNMVGLSVGIMAGIAVLNLTSYPPILAIATTLGTWFIGGLLVVQIRH